MDRLGSGLGPRSAIGTRVRKARHKVSGKSMMPGRGSSAAKAAKTGGPPNE